MPSIKNISGRNKIDTQKNPKKPNGLAFFKKTRVFTQPCVFWILILLLIRILLYKY